MLFLPFFAGVSCQEQGWHARAMPIHPDQSERDFRTSQYWGEDWSDACHSLANCQRQPQPFKRLGCNWRLSRFTLYTILHLTSPCVIIICIFGILWPFGFLFGLVRVGWNGFRPEHETCWLSRLRKLPGVSDVTWSIVFQFRYAYYILLLML